MKREKDIVKWADEIADFAKMVEDFTGKTLTVENLDAAIKTINAKRRALARVYEARKATNCIPISGKDALLVTQIVFFDDPARCAEMANKLAEELEQRVADGVSVFPAGTLSVSCLQERLLLFQTGSFITLLRRVAQRSCARKCAQERVTLKMRSMKVRLHLKVSLWLYLSVI